jgi:hypothetical protein
MIMGGGLRWLKRRRVNIISTSTSTSTSNGALWFVNFPMRKKIICETWLARLESWPLSCSSHNVIHTRGITYHQSFNLHATYIPSYIYQAPPPSTLFLPLPVFSPNPITDDTTKPQLYAILKRSRYSPLPCLQHSHSHSHSHHIRIGRARARAHTTFIIKMQPPGSRNIVHKRQKQLGTKAQNTSGQWILRVTRSKTGSALPHAQRRIEVHILLSAQPLRLLMNHSLVPYPLPLAGPPSLPHLTLPYLTLPYLALPCLTLPYLALPYSVS